MPPPGGGAITPKIIFMPPQGGGAINFKGVGGAPSSIFLLPRNAKSDSLGGGGGGGGNHVGDKYYSH